jgi:cell division transport system permease protein
MARIPYDIPLHRDPASRFLPWIIGLMVFLATLTLAGVMGADIAARRWLNTVGGALTVQVLPLAGEGPAKFGQRVQTTLEVLRETQGVAKAEPLTDATLTALLEPWLGAGPTLSDLPLPAMIDVELSGPGADLPLLRERLAREVAGTVVDDHAAWIGDLAVVVRTVQVVALFALLLLAGAALVAVSFAVRAGLAVHRETLEVLHIMGAGDVYIARQFERAAGSAALKGGLLGFLLAVAALFASAWALSTLLAMAPPAIGPWLWPAVALPAVPALAGLAAMLTARSAVLSALRQLP